MAPRTKVVLAATALLVASVNAQAGLPASCTAVYTLVQQCVPDLTDTSSFADPKVAQCICSDSSFDENLTDCLSDTGNLTPDLQQGLEQFSTYCATFGSGNGSSPTQTDDSTSTPTPTDDDSSSVTPTPTSGSVDDSEGVAACSSVSVEIDSCFTDSSANPTGSAIVSCLCGNGDFDSAVSDCYAYIGSTNADAAEVLSAYEGFCSSYGGGSGSMTTPTPRTSSRVINTPETTPTGSTPSRTASSGSSQTSSAGSSQTSTPPSSANSLKISVIGSALAALFVGVAVLL